MRKIWLVAAVISVLTLGSCGTAAHYEVYEYNDMDESYAALYTPLRDLFLHDLDYMLYVLENNFALFDVAYDVHGADITAIINYMREYVQGNTYIDTDEFFKTLNQSFAPLLNVGHFWIERPHAHYNVVNNPNAWERWFFHHDAARKWHYPHVLDFYEPRHPQNMPRSIDEIVNDWLYFEAPSMLQKWIVDRIALFGEKELSTEIAAAIDYNDKQRAAPLVTKAIEIFRDTPNISTEILEQDRIAYVSVNEFRDDGWEDILTFFEGIGGFEHLIIDLRRNTGGNPSFFYEYIMGPNMSERFRLHGYVFATAGEYVDVFLRGVPAFRALNPVTRNVPTDGQLRHLDYMLSDFDLPHLNMGHMARMDYGFLFQSPEILPRHHYRFGDEPAFTGKIWLLTGPFMGSAAQMSATVSIESGFATHVGEITGGNSGGSRTVAVLPNTGILFRFDVFYVTDERGRPLEAGTIPHHFNREGMDALETTLSLIAEGEY